MANSTLKFAANGFWGNSNSTKSNDDLDSVTTQLEKLPIKCEKDVSPEKTISSNHDQDKSSTVALSIPKNMKSTSQVAASNNTPSSGITFGMGSSWNANRRIRSSNSESGYGSSFYGSSIKSSLSLLGNKEENPEKQQFLDNLPLISLEEVQKHCYEDDAWMVFYDRVYNVTDFLYEVSY